MVKNSDGLPVRDPKTPDAIKPDTLADTTMASSSKSVATCSQ